MGVYGVGEGRERLCADDFHALRRPVSLENERRRHDLLQGFEVGRHKRRRSVDQRDHGVGIGRGDSLVGIEAGDRFGDALEEVIGRKAGVLGSLVFELQLDHVPELVMQARGLCEVEHAIGVLRNPAQVVAVEEGEALVLDAELSGSDVVLN